MSGAIAFIKGLLGLGAAAGVSVGQSVGQAKRQAEMDEIYKAKAEERYNGELRQMHDRVRKEWLSIPDCHPNCLGKWPQDYPSHMGLYYRDKFWFRDHLKAKGIPYDDEILDEVCGVNYEKLLNKMMYNAGKKRRGWF